MFLSKPDDLEHDQQMHPSDMNLRQRLTYYCVSIPGETEWVKNVKLFDTLGISLRTI